VDNFHGLDRLDRWLNSRQGEQRSILNWLQAFIMGWLLGMVGWFSWALFALVHFASAPLIALPVIALAAAVLAVPLRRLPPALHAWRSRRYPAKTGPEFTWRQIVTGALFALSELLGAVNGSVGPSLPRGLVVALAGLQLIVALPILPLVLTMSSYTRRYAQAREGGHVGYEHARTLPPR